MLGIERIALLEILPEIADGLLAFVVSGTDGEAAFRLPYEPRIRRPCARADDEEVVRVEAEMLGLEMDFGDAGIGQDRRNAADEELSQPVGRNMLLEEHALAAGGDRTRNSFLAWAIHAIHQVRKPFKGLVQCRITSPLTRR